MAGYVDYFGRKGKEAAAIGQAKSNEQYDLLEFLTGVAGIGGSELNRHMEGAGGNKSRRINRRYAQKDFERGNQALDDRQATLTRMMAKRRKFQADRDAAMGRDSAPAGNVEATSSQAQSAQDQVNFDENMALREIERARQSLKLNHEQAKKLARAARAAARKANLIRIGTGLAAAAATAIPGVGIVAGPAIAAGGQVYANRTQ